jgi:HAD superfamily phosphoserine phosphatase-like hydrolase
VGAELAVFDFDGTLTRTDTLIPFLFTVDPARTLRHAPTAVVAAKRFPDRRDQLKEALIGRVLAQRSAQQLAAAGERFARTVLPGLLRPDVVAHLEGHRAAGRVVAVASASPEVVVGPAARRLGVERVVCTQLTAPSCRSEPWRYRDGNCRGEVKLARLEELVRDVGAERLWVYGNLPDDAAILDRADVAVTVGRRRVAPLT